MNRTKLFTGLAFAGFLLSAGSAVSAPLPAADSLKGVPGHIIKVSIANEARGFVSDMTQSGLAFLADENLTQSEKTASFRKLLNRSFDLDAIGKFTIGRYWKQMTPDQKSEYLKLFNDMVVRTYSRRFSEYQGQTVEVTGSRPNGDNEAFVDSTINDPNGSEPVKVVWRVRNKGGNMKIIDVVVAGVSMSVTQRSDFASVIQRGGGNVEALLTHLRQ